MAREIEMIRNGGGLIDVALCDGSLDYASVFSKSIAKATFSFPYVLDPAFVTLYHVHEVRRRAGDVMPYTFLLVSSEESVRRGSFFNKTARFTPSYSLPCYQNFTGRVSLPPEQLRRGLDILVFAACLLLHFCF